MLFITIVSCLFDWFIIMNFFNHTLITKKNIHPVLFCGAFIIAEITMNVSTFLYEIIPPSIFSILNILISTFTIFLLSLLYEGRIKLRLLLSILYILLANIADDTFSIVISSYYPDIMENMSTNSIILGGFCVEMILFIFTLIFSLFWNRKIASHPFQYNILVLSIPIASLVISFLIMTDSLAESYETNRITAIRLILFVVNISNSFLLDESFQNHFLKKKATLLETEIQYQKEKYAQISSSYRRIKKIVHDTKKHYFTINKLIEADNKEELKLYLDQSITDLEGTYAMFNTGNLVIDSYLAYYNTLFIEKNVHFKSNINLDIKRIPLEDYDLSIVLGNILDNGYNATTSSPATDKITFLIELYTNDKNQLIIHTKNPYEKYDSNKNNIEHGYGLSNIQAIVTKHNGIMNITASSDFEVFILIPLTKES